MSGELVKIGASRGALAAWSILIKILVNQKLPIKVLEQLLSDLLGDILQDLTKESSDVVTAYEDIPNSSTVCEQSQAIVMQSQAIGVRLEATIPDGFGKLFGGNGSPPTYAFNSYLNCPGGFTWQHIPWDSVSHFERINFPRQLALFPSTIKPYAINMYINPGASVIVWQIRKKS
jgi:hypothetical protein